jgi:hypothetical protein
MKRSGMKSPFDWVYLKQSHFYAVANKREILRLVSLAQDDIVGWVTMAGIRL